MAHSTIKYLHIANVSVTRIGQEVHVVCKEWMSEGNEPIAVQRCVVYDME